jgi:phenylalanyl-tRNA synthetase beta chain
VALFETATVTLARSAGPAPIPPVERRPSAEEFAALNAAIPDQPLHLGLVVSGERERSGWWGAGRSASWQDAVGMVQEVAAALGVEVAVRPGARAPWHPGRCAEFLLGDLVVGHAGELHPTVCRSFVLPARTAAAEVDLEPLLAAAVDVVKGPAFSSYPVAREDVALVVDSSVAAADLESALREGAGAMLESIRLFDVYTGDQVGEGKKSLAFRLRFRAPDRTLTDEETGVLRDAAVAAAATRFAAVQR